MRITNKTTEVYVFNGIHFMRNDSWRMTADHVPYTTKFPFRHISEEFKNVVKHLSNSTSLEKLAVEPKYVTATLDEQLKDLINFMAEDFDIHLDEQNRFYRHVRVNNNYFDVRTSKFVSKKIYKTEFISWKIAIQLYNTPFRYIDKITDPYDIWPKSPLLKELINNYKNLFEINKKYDIIHLQRTKHGFKIDSDRVFQLPK